MGTIDDPVGFLIRTADHFGFADEPLLLSLPLCDGTAIGIIARSDKTITFCLRAFGEGIGLTPCIGDGAISGVIGFGHHGVGVVGGILDHRIRFIGGPLKQIPGFHLGVLEKGARTFLRLPDETVPMIEHILSVIEFGG